MLILKKRSLQFSTESISATSSVCIQRDITLYILQIFLENELGLSISEIYMTMSEFASAHSQLFSVF